MVRKTGARKCSRFIMATVSGACVRGIKVMEELSASFLLICYSCSSLIHVFFPGSILDDVTDDDDDDDADAGDDNGNMQSGARSYVDSI